MTVSGFTFVYHAIERDYPVVESIKSMLPICDEFIVNVGLPDDGTIDLIKSIDDKIKIITTPWYPKRIRLGGWRYDQFANIPLFSCQGDWKLSTNKTCRKSKRQCQNMRTILKWRAFC